MALVLHTVSSPSQESYLLYLHPITGHEYEDTMTIAGVDIRQSIGVALDSFGLYPVDGILG
jgi:hypothetical protein